MTPYYADAWLTVYEGDCRAVLAELPSESVHCVVTSPPYWGLRDYGVSGQLGLEPTPEEYVANMVAVFREVRRVLRADGTLWLNLGDSYAGSWGARGRSNETNAPRPDLEAKYGTDAPNRAVPGLKPKDLVGIPWRVAFALQQPYYTGTIRDERDRIWLAAMLDAEGCLFLHKRKVGQSNGQGYYRKADSYGAGMEIANTSLAIVERCMQIAGGRGSITRQEKDRRQPLYRWSMRSNECRDVVRELYPHLVAKQHQARLLLGCPSSGPDAEKAHAGLIELHGGGVPSIDFPAPPSLLEPGWYLRSDVIWSKLNPMPESVTDRPTKAHEHLFLLSKSARYYYDTDAVREAFLDPAGSARRQLKPDGWATGNGAHTPVAHYTGRDGDEPTEYGAPSAHSGRNLRSVWTIATRPYPGAHFATFPPELPERCIKAGTSEKGVCPECGAPWERVVERTPMVIRESGRRESVGGQATFAGRTAASGTMLEPPRSETVGWHPSCVHDAEPVAATVLDPFAGSGTTGMVAQSLSRRAVLIDLNGEYLTQAMERNRDIPLGLAG